MVGEDNYINDPKSGDWVKVGDIPAEIYEMFLMASTFEGQFLNAGDGQIEWDEVSLSEDGAKYMLSFSISDAQAAPNFVAPEFRIVIDAASFLHDSMDIAMDVDGVERKIVEIEYSRHNEQFEIEAPSDYIGVGAVPILGGDASGLASSSERIDLVGFSKNSDGDIEMRFSGPVAVEGRISLYVFDPALGEADGWELPMIGGDGSDALIFDAEPDGKPTLVSGGSVVAGVVFNSPDADILNANGDSVTIYFDEWVFYHRRP